VAQNPYAAAPEHPPISPGGAVSTLVSMLPNLYTQGDYADSQWEDWFNKTRPRDELNRPLTQEGLEHMRFMETASERLEQRMFEFVAANPEAAKRFSSEDAEEARYSILGLQRQPRTETGRQLLDEFLGWMQQGGLGEEGAGDTSVTPMQMEEWQNDPDPVRRRNANYRLSPIGKQAMQKTIDYNLFATFQTDPYHRPVALQNPMISGIGGLVGSVFDLSGGVNQAFADTPGNRQNRAVLTPSPLNAMRYSMGLYDKTKQKDEQNRPIVDPELWNTSAGSPIPQGSLMTHIGLENKMATPNTSYGAATQAMTARLMMPQFQRHADDYNKQRIDFYMGRQAEHPMPEYSQTPQNVSDYVTFLRNNARFTPIRFPDHSATALTEQGKTMEGDNYRQITTNFPQFVRKFGHPGFYPSAFVNDAAMVIPSIAGDPGNAAMTAGMAGLGVATGGGFPAVGAAIAGNAGDIPSELGFNTAMTLGQTPQTPWEYFTQPDPNVPLRTPDGRIPEPTLPEYDTALEEYKESRQKTLDDMGAFNNNQQKQANKVEELLQYGRDSGRPVMFQMPPRPPEPVTAPAKPLKKPYISQGQLRATPRRPFD
jgi:hypothetical protein